MMLVAEPEVRMTRLRLRPLAVVGSLAGALFVAATLIRYGIDARAMLWAGAQLLLAFLACFDLATRRVPNWVTVPAAVVVVVLRGAFAPSTLLEMLTAGAIAFGFFLLVAVLTRGGLGMGDVKLAGLIGLLLGKAALPALFVGVVAGGAASLVVLVWSRRRGHTVAYAPYLCFGAAIAILAFGPPPLV